MSKEKKALVFTHTDLDGLSSLYLVESLSKKIGVCPENKVFDYSLCTTGTYGTINNKISQFVDNKRFYYYDTVYITDLSPDLEVFSKLIECCQKNGIYLKLIDHHETNKYLGEMFPEYATVIPEIEGELTSGTSLVVKHFVETYADLLTEEKMFLLDNDELLSEIVRMYDTWDWNKYPEKEFSKEAKDLNALFIYYRNDEFLEKLKEYQNPIKIIEDGQIILSVLNNLEQKTVYKETMSRNVKKSSLMFEDKEYEFVYVYSTSYINEISTKLQLDYPEVDFVAIINGDYISFRNSDDKINLSEMVSKKFNGGGHPNASGCKISELDSYIKNFLK